jgi:hypothetical protein
MIDITPRICIDGREVDYIKGNYKSDGNLKSANITFTISQIFGGTKKLWNKEVTFYLNKQDGVPLFRGWVRRVNDSYNDIEIYAEDALGYLIKSGEEGDAKVVLTDYDNIDGLTVGAAVQTILNKSKLDTKLKTDLVGDTDPVLSTGVPFRGTVVVLDVVKELLGRAINNSGDLPKPNLGKIIDDGTNSQFVIELEKDVETTVPKFVFTEKYNIQDINIIRKKVPTVVIVNGSNGSAGTFIHDGALAALDRNYLEVDNTSKGSPAECKDFASKLFEANLKIQYEYDIKVLDGAYLQENDVIQVVTEDPEYSGNFRVIGKSIEFSPSSFSFGLNINRKPPTLAEYISDRQN